MFSTFTANYRKTGSYDGEHDSTKNDDRNGGRYVTAGFMPKQ